MYIHFRKLVKKKINIFILFSSCLILKHQLVYCKFILYVVFLSGLKSDKQWVKKIPSGFSKEILVKRSAQHHILFDSIMSNC